MVGGTSDFDPSEPLALSPLLTLACTLAAVALLWLAFFRQTTSRGEK